MPTVIDGTLGVDKVKGAVAAVAAGLVGEIQSAAGGVIGMTSGIATTVASLTLTAGVWDVEGLIEYAGAGCALQRISADVGTVAATMATSIALAYSQTWTSGSTGTIVLPARVRRIVLPSGGTVYLNSHMYFSAGTAASTANSQITARRVA